MEQDIPRFEFYDIETDSGESETDSGDSDSDDISETEGRTLKVRLYKWLWAARFFKTLSLARAAVENGKVYYNGERSKPSREIEIEAVLQIRHGRYEKTVIVKGLSTRRRSTEEALQLFEETDESRMARESMAEYQATPMGQPMPYGVYNSPFAATDQGPKRRAVRFLRRSFVRAGEGQSMDTCSHTNQNTHQGYRHNKPAVASSPTLTRSPRQEHHRANMHHGYPNQQSSHHSRNHGAYDNRRPDNYRHDHHSHSHHHHSEHAPHAYRQPSHYSAQPQNGNQLPYPQSPNHGYQGHHTRHQNNHNYNYYGPQSYKETNGNIGHLPFKERETEIEESSD